MSILQHFGIASTAAVASPQSVTAPAIAAVPPTSVNGSNGNNAALNNGGSQAQTTATDDQEVDDDDDDDDAHSIITISSDSDDEPTSNTGTQVATANTNGVAGNPTVAAHIAGIMGIQNVNPTPAFVVFVSPWIGGRAYGIVPPVDLVCDNAIHSADWYTIYVGHWVGVLAVQPLAHAATNGVSGSLYRWFPTQQEAISAFNTSRTLGVVRVV